MTKNEKSRDIGKVVWMTPLQNAGQNHFQKIGKFEKISQWENKNIKEQRRNLRNYLSLFRCCVAMTTPYT